jgi:hypothetical protein
MRLTSVESLHLLEIKVRRTNYFYDQLLEKNSIPIPESDISTDSVIYYDFLAY